MSSNSVCHYTLKSTLFIISITDWPIAESEFSKQGETGVGVGIEAVKFTAMNMYKYKEGLRFRKHWPCST